MDKCFLEDSVCLLTDEKVGKAVTEFTYVRGVPSLKPVRATLS